MAKRFSAREFGLLMAPVLVVGAVGLWVSLHPKSRANDGKPQVTFEIVKPTTLEAFEGKAGSFVVFFEVFPRPLEAEKSTLYLELQTLPNLRSSPSANPHQILWKQSKAGFPDSTTVFKNRHLPPGNLYFGLDGSFKTWDAQGTQNLIPLHKKWKVDRAQLKAPNLTAVPRKPKIALLEVKISNLDSAPSPVNKTVSGKAVFGFEDAAMNDQTPLEMKLSSSEAEMDNRTEARAPREAHRRTISWTASPLNIPSSIVRISGRVSADNRWPLGFEIEPFDFKSAKVGQKLRFRQGPVALPKS